MSLICTHKIKQHNLLAEFKCKHMQHYILSVNIKSIIHKQQIRIHLCVTWMITIIFSVIVLKPSNEDLSESATQCVKILEICLWCYSIIHIKLQFIWFSLHQVKLNAILSIITALDNGSFML